MYAASPNLLISNHSYGALAGWNFDTDNNQWQWLGNPGDTVDYKFGYYDDQFPRFGIPSLTMRLII